MAIEYVGECFPTIDKFLKYLESIQFGAWRPSYVVMHHTGSPDLRTWTSWQERAKPVTDEQWMHNLAEYYGSAPPKGPSDGPWQRAPQFFFTPKHYCVLSMPTSRGTHAKSFNAHSWGVECVGDFDREPLEAPLAERYAAGLAALHLATGLRPSPFQKAVRGLHFHRDDPLTTKTCPGNNVVKSTIVRLVEANMLRLDKEDERDEVIAVDEDSTIRNGHVVHVPAGDVLNVRAAASSRSPKVAAFSLGDKIIVTGSSKNGDTTWLRIDLPGDTDGYVSANYVRLT